MYLMVLQFFIFFFNLFSTSFDYSPHLMIVLTIVGLNCIGEGIRKKYLS